jgi:hypothetical protein
MWSKRKRSSDWLSYDLCFKGLGFLIISIVLIGVVTTTSNLKPLNLDLKEDQQSWASTSFKSWIFAHGYMGSFIMK